MWCHHSKHICRVLLLGLSKVSLKQRRFILLVCLILCFGISLIILFYLFILSFLHLFTCIHCLGHFPPLPGRICSCSFLLFSNFVEEIIRKTAFLLVWGKDSYTERFLVLLPCTCVLQPTLVHLYQPASLLPSPLPIMASASLRLLYSLLYSEHINHIQVLAFLPFPYSSHSHSPLSV
jgi:hypothetical protein